LLYLH